MASTSQEAAVGDFAITIPEHPDGGLVADPWEGVTVRVRFHRPVRMSYADIQRRAPGWPERREQLREHMRQVGAVQVEMFGGGER